MCSALQESRHGRLAGTTLASPLPADAAAEWEIVMRSQLQPPTATLALPELCDVNGDAKCSLADAVIVRCALLTPPTAAI
jgi:hypothetical protein